MTDRPYRSTLTSTSRHAYPRGPTVAQWVVAKGPVERCDLEPGRAAHRRAGRGSRAGTRPTRARPKPRGRWHAGLRAPRRTGRRPRTASRAAPPRDRRRAARSSRRSSEPWPHPCPAGFGTKRHPARATPACPSRAVRTAGGGTSRALTVGRRALGLRARSPWSSPRCADRPSKLVMNVVRFVGRTTVGPSNPGTAQTPDRAALRVHDAPEQALSRWLTGLSRR
jgi:hypothetical protein